MMFEMRPVAVGLLLLAMGWSPGVNGEAGNICSGKGTFPLFFIHPCLLFQRYNPKACTLNVLRPGIIPHLKKKNLFNFASLEATHLRFSNLKTS